MPLYAIGGMGAGDVKLMAGLGAWIGPALTLWAFLSTAMVGGLMGVAMMVALGRAVPSSRHDAVHRPGSPRRCAIPRILAEMAARRKPTMLLLPYGIPIAIGTITYLAWAGLLG